MASAIMGLILGIPSTANTQTRKSIIIEAIELCVSVETQIPRLTIAKIKRSVINSMATRAGQISGDETTITEDVFRMIREANKAITNGTSKTK